MFFQFHEISKKFTNRVLTYLFLVNNAYLTVPIRNMTVDYFHFRVQRLSFYQVFGVKQRLSSILSQLMMY